MDEFLKTLKMIWFGSMCRMVMSNLFANNLHGGVVNLEAETHGR